MTDLNIPGICGLVVFYAIILAIGLIGSWYKMRQQKGKVSGTESIIAGGRDIGILVGAFTMTATWVGGGYINGTAEAIFQPSLGLVWCQAPVGYTLSLVVGGLFFADVMRKKKYLTMLDPFQQKYGARIGGCMYFPALMAELFWSAAILNALGTTIVIILNLRMDIAIISSAIVAMLYTFVGGIFSVTYTDTAQLVFIFFGLILCIPFAWFNPNVHINGFPPSNATSNLTVVETSWLGTLDQKFIGTYIDNYLLVIFGGVPWQSYFQRVLSTQSSFKARMLSFAGAFGCLLVAIPSVLIGYIARHADWDAAGYNATLVTKNPSLVLPAAIEYLTPTAVAFFGLSAVSAAVMSSADASFLSASSMFSHNIYKLVFRQNASDKEILWILRFCIIAVGSIAAVLAIQITSIYSLFVLCSDLVYVILFPQLVAVLFVPFVNKPGAVCGYLMGLILRLLGGEKALDLPVIIEYPYYNAVDGQLFPFRTLATLCNFATIIVVSLIFCIPFMAQCCQRVDDIYQQFAIYFDNAFDPKWTALKAKVHNTFDAPWMAVTSTADNISQRVKSRLSFPHRNRDAATNTSSHSELYREQDINIPSFQISKNISDTEELHKNGFLNQYGAIDLPMRAV